MPTTIKKIAESCGVSKATVRRRLEELGLNNDQHVTVAGQKHIVSDYAASAVAASLANHAKAEDSEPGQNTVEAMYERYITLLEADKARLESQVAEKDREMARLNEAIVDLASKVAESQKRPSLWERLLPSMSRGK